MPPALANNSHRPVGERETVDFLEPQRRRHCGRPLSVKTRSDWRTRVDLGANVEGRVTYRRCGDPSCPGREEAARP
ncbi:MAG: hypothetical protein ACTSU5_05040 [Promethearchaeota archaeon]